MRLYPKPLHDRSRFGLACQLHRLVVLACFCFITSMMFTSSESTATEIYLQNGQLWEEGQPLPLPEPDSQPVLFVHGHGTSLCSLSDLFCSCEEDSGCENYRRTWVDSLDNGLRSFADAIDQNPQLNIEPYYLNIEENTQSIVADAQAIAEAVERVLARHNSRVSRSPFPRVPTRVAIIAHSKGTISTRLYLKSLYDPLPEYEDELPGNSAYLHPVSEFIAIAPPNHGAALWPNPSNPAIAAWALAQLLKEPIRQLNNGYAGLTCLPFSSTPSSIDFMARLNGHPITDTHEDTYVAHGNKFGQFPEEAPGSRKNGMPISQGPLYVTMYDPGCRDGVGCHEPRINDCASQGRSVAINLAPTAVNIPIHGLDGGDDMTVEGFVVHNNIVHHPDTICKALYAVTHHKADHSLKCRVTNQIPKVPAP